MTAFNELLGAVRTAIAAAPEVAGIDIVVGRRRPLSRDCDKGIFITLDASRAARNVLGAMDWTTRFVVECTARAPAGQSPEQAVDALLEVVYAQVLTLNQAAYPSLIDVSPTPDIDWQSEDLDTSIALARISFDAVHRTQEQTLTSWA